MQVLREISVKKRRHEISQHPNSGTSFLPRHSLSLCSQHEQVDHACCLADSFKSSRGKKSMSTSRATGSLHCLQSQSPRFYILKNTIASLHFLHLITNKVNNICSPHEQVDHDPFRSSRGKKSMSTSRATGSLHCPRFYILKNMITSLHFLHLIPTKFRNIFRNQVAMIRGKLL